MTRIDTFLCMSCLTLLCSTGFKTVMPPSGVFVEWEQQDMAATIVEPIQAAGDPWENCVTAMNVSSTDFAQVHEDLRFTTFTFSDGGFRFEAPAIWLQPSDPNDSKLKAFFLGPVDRTAHTVVFLGVSRYPGNPEAMMQEIERLKTDKGTQVLMHQTCALDQRPTHILTVRSRTAAPMWESAPVPHESVAIVLDGLDWYVLEYASTPEFYEEYHPVFQRLVASFHFIMTRGRGVCRDENAKTLARSATLIGGYKFRMNTKTMRLLQRGLLGVLILSVTGCTTELPALVRQDQVTDSLVVGRVLTVLTGERSRRYGPQLRFFELEDQDSQKRFQVEVESPDQRFAISLPPGRYQLTRVQISEGPFMSMADLSMAFSVDASVTYVGTWRFGVDSPRYGRIVVTSVVTDPAEAAGVRDFLDDQYPTFGSRSMVETLPQPAQTESRLYEVMPYPRYPTYFRRHWW